MPQSQSQQPEREMTIQSEDLIFEGHSYNFVDLSVLYRDGVVRNKPMVRHNGAATILPILDSPDGAKIVMVRNERVTVDDFVLELPAGGIDKGEDPAEAAARELIEETGYSAGVIEPLCSFLTTPGLTDEWMHIFVARKLSFVGQQLEPYESISVELFSPTIALNMVRDNTIVDGKTMLAIREAHDRGII